MNNYDQYDHESQALLHGIKPLSFEEVMGSRVENPFNDLAKNTSNTAVRRKNPLAYSPLSKSGTDIQNNFFQGSKIYRNNNLQITVDPSSSIDPYKKIIPIERGFYYDKNNNGIQDEDEKYVVTIKLYIAKEASQLRKIYEDPTIKPDPKEILFFLEDNDNDFSGTTLYIKRGSQVDAVLSRMLADSKTFTNYIKSQYGISLSDLQELIKEGVVKNNIQNFIFSIVELASFIVANPAIFKGIALAIKKAVDTIKETCTVEEKNWNPQKAEGNFSPFLFPFAPVLDTLDDKAINDFIKSGIQKLNEEANTFDKKIENTLSLISEVKIPFLLPFGMSRMVNAPETFTDLLLMKYRELRMTMEGIIANLNNIDFSTLIKDGLNVVNAFLCGIWNGFVEAVCGIISLVQYLFQGAESLTDLLKNFKEKGPDLLEKIDDIILQFQQIDFGKIFTKLASNIKEWVLSAPTISLVELAYFSGMFIGIVVELVIEIVVGVLFTGGTLSITAILAKLGETFKALGSLLINVVKAPFKLAGKTVSAFTDGLNWLYEFLKKGTDEILRVLDEVFEGLNNIPDRIKTSRKLSPAEERLVQKKEVLRKKSETRNKRNEVKKLDAERKKRIKKFWKDGYDPDPSFSVWGIGKLSHPELWKQIMDDLISKGCKIKIGEKNLTYGASSIKGQPGNLTITDNSSITALMHEARHFYDDLANGFPSLSYYMQNPKIIWKMEYNAYMEEIIFLRKNGEIQPAKKLLKNALDEKKYIEEFYNIKL